MEKLYNILLGIVRSESNDTIDCQIAIYLLKHIQDFDLVTVNDLASICQVSKSSVSRFCRRIGLDDFYELKHMLHHFQINESKYAFENHSTSDIPYIQYIETVSKHINDLKDKLDFNLLDQLTNDIYHYDNVIVAGNLQANSICMNLQLHLFSCKKLVQTKIKVAELREVIEKANKETLIIVFSSTGAFFKRLFLRDMRLLKKDKPKICLITLSAKIAEFPYVDYTIKTNTPSDYASGHFQLETISNLIGFQYYHKYKNDLFK